MKSERLSDKLCRTRYISRYGLYVACCVVFLPLLLLASCGRKGPPTLKAYEKPEAPTGLSAVHIEKRIVLSWSYPAKLRPSIKGFQILRAEGEGFQRRAFVDSKQSSFSDEDFTPDVAYTYQVVAENLKGILGAAPESINVVPGLLPPPPDDISFSIRPDSVELSWKSSGEGVCYNVYRTMEKGRYGDAPLNRKPVCATSFEDGSPSLEESAYYTIRALHNTPLKDEGFPSGELVVEPADFVPSPPSELTTVKTGAKTYLVWRESPESWVKGYRIYRKMEGEKDFTRIGESKSPAFTDESRGRRRAWYMIRALGPSAESPPATVDVR